MKIKRVLDEQDIKNIIAKNFYVEPENVKINMKARPEGYGPGEHYVDYVEIEIEEEYEYGGKNKNSGTYTYITGSTPLNVSTGKPADYTGTV